MEIPIFQIDTFTNNVFSGNPAAVCILEEWLDDSRLLSIAKENNLSETAFCVKSSDQYELRWFTPVAEIDLCGHATLASAYVIMEHITATQNSVSFKTKSGILNVRYMDKQLIMDFPARNAEPCKAPDDLIRGLGAKPSEILASRDYMAIYGNEEEIVSLQPDMAVLRSIDRFGVIVTAPGKTVDFVSRFFAPKAGIPEDPVTGSAHCTLIPYWSKRLSKSKLHALQVSERGGELFCKDAGDRVEIAGYAKLYLKGSIYLD